MRARVAMAGLGLLAVASLATFGAKVLAESGQLQVALQFGTYCDAEGGGEIGIQKGSVTGLTVPAMGANSANPDREFETFCLEKNNDIWSSVWDYETSTQAVGGGIGGGSPDPLSPETAYLFYHFWYGDLGGYNWVAGAGRTASAHELARAIWALEDEVRENAADLDPPDGSGIVTLDPVADAQALTWISEARHAVHDASGSWKTTFGETSIGPVRVLNITDLNGQGDYQDLLVLVQSTDIPGLTIDKTASASQINAGASITYTYTVKNTGNVQVDNVNIVDDNGTPGNPSDDLYFPGPGPNTPGLSLAPGASHQFTVTEILPIPFCDPNNPGAGTVGTMTITDMGGSYRIRYTQNRSLNDNTYGSLPAGQFGAASAGWGSHSFGNLTGSDKCEFAIYDTKGVKVLDFFEDYVSAATKGPAPTFTTYPGGYGTLGATGGDGSFVSGNLAWLVGFNTGMTYDMNLGLPGPQSPYTTNSPGETAPLSGISTPTAGWDYNDWFEVDVSKAAFFDGVLGSVLIPTIHNSPAKTGSNQIFPTPCDATITNTATATATYGPNNTPVPVTADMTDFATVTVKGSTTTSSGTVAFAAAPTLKDKKLEFKLKNTGTTAATISRIVFTWPNGDGRLNDIKNGTHTIFLGPVNGPTLDTSTFTGTATDRKVNAGSTITLRFDFQNAVAGTALSQYHLTI